LVHELALREHVTVGRAVAADREHEPRRHADPAPHLHRSAGLIPVRPDQDVRENVVPRDDPADRLPEDFGALEDRPEELRIRPVLAQRTYGAGSGSCRIAASASRSRTSTARW